jgi:membrane protein
VVCKAASYSAAILSSWGEAGLEVLTAKKQRVGCCFPYNPAGGRVVRILQNTLRGLGRIFPDCITLSQAIAFNMFLAFFPVLLFLLGVLSTTAYFHNAVREIPQRLTTILPPGSDQMVVQYFVRRGLHPLKWITLGLAGALLAGSQVMVGFIEGFRLIEGDLLRLSFWRLYLRSTILLSLTSAPFLAVVVLTVFGKQARGWLIKQIGLSTLIHALGFAAYVAIVFLLAMCVLVVMYRFGRPGERSYREVLPGALVATVLWWAADISFGFYVRKMPYDAVYGGLAAAIGLLLWMYLTAIVVLVGAAYNAEAREALQLQHKGLRIWERAT